MILLQLVEPKDYGKFCETSVIVQCNVLSSQPVHDGDDSMFELGFSVNSDDMHFNGQPSKRHTMNENPADPLDISGGAAEKKRQALIAMIDDGLNENDRSSAIYDEKSIDLDARSIVGSLHEADPEDEALKNAQALLASLKQDRDEVYDEAAEEQKKQEVREKMAKLGTMIDKADALRQDNT